MIGNVVEIEGREGLYVVVKEENYEDLGSCSYGRDYWIVPYQLKVDDMEVRLDKSECLKIRSVHLPVKVREDKKPYILYGSSNIRGVEKVYLERIWEEVILPCR